MDAVIPVDTVGKLLRLLRPHDETLQAAVSAVLADSPAEAVVLLLDVVPAAQVPSVMALWDEMRPLRVHPLGPPSEDPPRPVEVHVSERELQVLRGMSQGKTDRQIGRELFVSEDTVKARASRLFRKLKANGRAQAVARGYQLGLLVVA